jgi:hypothetical protein
MPDSSMVQAVIIFISSGLLIIISVLLLQPNWKYLNQMLLSLPEDDRRIFRSIRLISDERERDKAWQIILFFVGFSCLIVTIFLSMFAMVEVIAQMLSYQLGPYQLQN